MSNSFSIFRFASVLATCLLAASWLMAADEKPAAAESSAETPHVEPAEEMLNAGHDSHADGGHHDPTDLGHGNGTVTIGSPIDFRFDLAIWTFVVFVLLLVILGKFAWGPIAEGLEKRERGIEEQIADAKRSSERAAEQLKLYEAKLAKAADEAREIALQARKDAEAMKEQMLAEAKAGAQRERERAVEDIANAKNNALREIAEKSVNTAVNLASSIVRREIKPTDHAQLIRDAMENFPSAN